MSISGPPSFLGGDFVIRRSTITGTGATQSLVPANPDRWALMIGMPSNQTASIDTAGTILAGGGAAITSTQGPWIQTFATLGPLIGYAWNVITSPGIQLTIWDISYQPKR